MADVMEKAFEPELVIDEDIAYEAMSDDDNAVNAALDEELKGTELEGAEDVENSDAAEDDGAEVNTEAEGNADEDRAEEFEKLVDVDDVVVDMDQVDNMGKRVKQFTKQGASDSLAEYFARIEQQNLQYRRNAKPATVSEADSLLEMIATAQGMELDQFKRIAPDWAKEIAIAAKLEQPEFQQYDQEAARRLATAEVEKDLLAKQALMKQAQHDKEQQLAQDLQKLYTKFPDTKDKKMPPEVIAKYQAGATPLEAYQEYLLEQKQNNELVKNKAKQEAAKAAKKSTGSAKPAAPPEDMDAASTVMRFFG